MSNNSNPSLKNKIESSEKRYRQFDLLVVKTARVETMAKQPRVMTNRPDVLAQRSKLESNSPEKPDTTGRDAV